MSESEWKKKSFYFGKHQFLLHKFARGPHRSIASVQKDFRFSKKKANVKRNDEAHKTENLIGGWRKKKNRI